MEIALNNKYLARIILLLILIIITMLFISYVIDKDNKNIATINNDVYIGYPWAF